MVCYTEMENWGKNWHLEVVCCCYRNLNGVALALGLRGWLVEVTGATCSILAEPGRPEWKLLLEAVKGQLMWDSSETTVNTAMSNNLEDRKCNWWFCGFKVRFTFRMLKESINFLKVIYNRAWEERDELKKELICLQAEFKVLVNMEGPGYAGLGNKTISHFQFL